MSGPPPSFVIVPFEGGVVLYDIVCCIGAAFGHSGAPGTVICQTDRQKGPDRQRQVA